MYVYVYIYISLSLSLSACVCVCACSNIDKLVMKPPKTSDLVFLFLEELFCGYYNRASYSRLYRKNYFSRKIRFNGVVCALSHLPL